MRDTKVTVASLVSVVIDPARNLEAVRRACAVAARDGARMVFLPELMLTGHAGHPRMIENAEPVPDGPATRAVLELSKQHHLCVCVGIAELAHGIVYNSQIVCDRGEYLGLQRKINLSSDEYLFFGQGERLEVFDIDDLRFGIIICYDNNFPELALALSLQHVDLILAPHAARTGVWPDKPDEAFKTGIMCSQLDQWALVHRARAHDHNVFVLLNNTVGPSTAGLAELDGYPAFGPGGVDPRKVIANHAGTLMGVAPGGEVFLRSNLKDFVEEIVTVELKADRRAINHGYKRNRRPATMLSILEHGWRMGE